MTLTEELFALTRAFDEAGIEYAVCGGLAMAFHGFARTTQDIDVLIKRDRIQDAAAAAQKLGFIINAGWIPFNQGQSELYRVTKIDQDHRDIIPLDLLSVTPGLQDVWRTRHQVQTSSGDIWVVSITGLVAMKRNSERKQDLADIERLESENETG